MNTSDRIAVECNRVGLAFDVTQPLNEVVPGCFLFYGTELSDDCINYGACRVQSYYAIIDPNTISIRSRR